MATLQLIANAVNAKLLHANRDIKLEVSDLLSYYVEGYEHSKAFAGGYWDGRSSFFEFNKSMFPAGFVNHVYNYLTRKGHKVQLMRKPAPEPLGPKQPRVDSHGEDPRYDYQMETVERLLKHKSMIAQIATGGGKSRVAALAVARIKRPTLFLTTRQVLMYQMRDTFEEANMKVGVLGDTIWKPIRGVNVGMVQTFAAKLRPIISDERVEYSEEALKECIRVQKLLEYFEFVILEEAHESSASNFYDIVRLMRNAQYRLALTATPFMRPDAEANMRLMATCGEIGIQVSEKMLIDRGILARPIFKFAKVGKWEKLNRHFNWQKSYTVGIVENQNRNQAIIDHVKTFKDHGLTAMILVQRKKHGTDLKHMLKSEGVRVDYIFGEHDQASRKRSLDKLKNGEIDVLIGSTILDVGVDVPAVGAIIIAGGGKSEVNQRQRIGRGLRAKKKGPNVCFIVDFDDRYNDHLIKHTRSRRAIIEKTPGFRENILEPHEDFNFEALGLRKAS